MIGWIYLLQIYPYNENVYKLGKTNNLISEINRDIYLTPLLIYEEYCENNQEHKTKLLKIFRNNFVSMKELGNQYFSGDPTQMKDKIEEYFLSVYKN